MLDFFLSHLSEIIMFLLSVISLVVHFFVFHRLKCTKDLAACMKECLPSYLSNFGLLQRIDVLESQYSELIGILREVSSNGNGR